MFLENVLGSRTKIKILRVLTEKRTAYTLKNLKEETNLSLGISHQACEELVEEKVLIKMKGTGKERLYKFNSNTALAAPLFEMFKTEKTRQRKEVILLHTWNVLESFVLKHKKRAHLVLLFGSQARGDATLRSDIDVLIVLRNINDRKQITKTKEKKEISQTILSLAAFKEEANNNTLFYGNLKKDSVLLYINPKIIQEFTPFLRDIQYNVPEEQ